MSERLLITGGAGFIGSNFILTYLQRHPEATIINLDKVSYAADLDNLAEVDSPNYQLIQGDICDRKLLDELFEKHQFTGVIHFAAESHVDNSIKGPEIFFQSNVMGTFQLIDAARLNWMQAPNQCKPGKAHCRFHHISTDEVYGTLSDTGLFTEQTPYAPNSPYSASKASSDFIVRSYFHTYGMNVVTTNCSNNFGPRQHDEKLIPTIIRHALNEKPIPIYGDGKHVRDWLYVADHVDGIELIFQQGKNGETYNLGGDHESQNLEIAREIGDILDKLKPRKQGSYRDLIELVGDRPGHDRRYAMDCTKIKDAFNWQAQTPFSKALTETVTWYVNKYV